MFSALFSQALELIGKSFLISAFVPTLVVAVGIALSVDARGSIELLEGWVSEEDLSNQATSALLLLASIYLAAYVIYGLRDALIWLFRTGWLWLAPLMPWRRDRFIQKRRNFDAAKQRSLAVPNATTWAEFGFGQTEPEDNPNRGKLLSQKTLSKNRRQLLKQLERLESRRDQFVELDPLPLAWEKKLEQVLVGMHMLSFQHRHLARNELEGLIERIRRLCGNDEKQLASWCSRIQQRTWSRVGDAHSADYYFPPEKYIQSTLLGNVLSWIATYPFERYGMSIDVIYPRLQKCIDVDFSRVVEDRKTFFDFAIILAGLCYAATVGFLLSWGGSVAVVPGRATSPAPGLHEVLQAYTPELLIALSWGVACMVFYLIAVAGAKAYGLMLHSAIDLYRLKLLEALHIKPADSLEAEQKTWKELSASFISRGVPDVALARTPDTSSPGGPSKLRKFLAASGRVRRSSTRSRVS